MPPGYGSDLLTWPISNPGLMHPPNTQKTAINENALIDCIFMPNV
jgi:hypothetical protein